MGLWGLWGCWVAELSAVGLCWIVGLSWRAMTLWGSESVGTVGI